MDNDRLIETLGRPELQWLVDKLTSRMGRGLGLMGTLTLRQLSVEQRDALGKLLGRPIRATSTPALQLAELELLLRDAGIAASLQEALEALAGPLINRREEAILNSETWSRVFHDAEMAIASDSQMRSWLQELESTGLIRRLSRQDVTTARTLLRQSLDIVCRLPAQGIPLAELAASAAGDSHALDAGSRLSAIVLRWVTRATGFDAFCNTEERRNAWAGVGVLCDELSAPVLILNLRGGNNSATERAMNIHADQGEPYRLSIRQLLRDRLEFHNAIRGNTVFVCENPAVVAATANRLGVRCAPLISIEGQPKTAAHLLLTKLRAANVRLLYHGDFDWAGIRIGNLMLRRYGAGPWRFSATDYIGAPKGNLLHGRPSEAEWDSRLAATMLQENKSVHEEAVMDLLSQDLGE